MKKSVIDLAKILRFRIIYTSYMAKIPHLGSCLSCIDILVALYWEILNINPYDAYNITRDRFILSKGHAAPALLQVLGLKDFFDVGLLNNYGENGSFFGEHPPAHGIPGIEAATGSLGHGLPVGVGLALGSMKLGIKNKIYVLMSDGECNEGSVWEAAMFAAAQKLENIVVIIDFNKWQATGRSEEVMSLSPLIDKWISFGWDAIEIDGHDIFEISRSVNNYKSNKKPFVLVAHTIKGKGVSFMEDDNNWHYRIPNEQEVAAAKLELNLSEYCYA